VTEPEKIEGKNWVVWIGEVRRCLSMIPDRSVHTIVTSPPYWNLRDYGVEGQIGLEATPAEFVAVMVDVFRECRRVLRDDGTCWINIGDSYNGPGGCDDLKPKDLCGIPWRLAFAIQDDGWWLRQDIIWHKGNPMPESVNDRCSKAHEYIFLLAKSARYFYDAEAVREPGTRTEWSTQKFKGGDLTKHHKSSIGPEPGDPNAGRNLRSVWKMNSEGTSVAHFAAFPSQLPARCIKAGTSEKGCCERCGAPWVRIIDSERVATRPGNRSKVHAVSTPGKAADLRHNGDNGLIIGNRDPQRHVSITRTVGWEPSCDCDAGDPVPCTVLDCFSGTGTTGMVATELGRKYIGCELNPEYALGSSVRIESWKHRDVAVKPVKAIPGQKALFT